MPVIRLSWSLETFAGRWWNTTIFFGTLGKSCMYTAASQAAGFHCYHTLFTVPWVTHSRYLVFLPDLHHRYAKTWADAFELIPNLYSERPPIEDFWEWRDLRVIDEIDWYGWFIDYWMEVSKLQIPPNDNFIQSSVFVTLNTIHSSSMHFSSYSPEPHYP